MFPIKESFRIGFWPCVISNLVSLMVFTLIIMFLGGTASGMQLLVILFLSLMMGVSLGCLDFHQSLKSKRNPNIKFEGKL